MDSGDNVHVEGWDWRILPILLGGLSVLFWIAAAVWFYQTQSKAAVFTSWLTGPLVGATFTRLVYPIIVEFVKRKMSSKSEAIRRNQYTFLNLATKDIADEVRALREYVPVFTLQEFAGALQLKVFNASANRTLYVEECCICTRGDPSRTAIRLAFSKVPVEKDKDWIQHIGWESIANNENLRKIPIDQLLLYDTICIRFTHPEPKIHTDALIGKFVQAAVDKRLWMYANPEAGYSNKWEFDEYVPLALHKSGLQPRISLEQFPNTENISAMFRIRNASEDTPLTVESIVLCLKGQPENEIPVISGIDLLEGGASLKPTETRYGSVSLEKFLDKLNEGNIRKPWAIGLRASGASSPKLLHSVASDGIVSSVRRLYQWRSENPDRRSTEGVWDYSGYNP